MAREPYLSALSDEAMASFSAMEGWSEAAVENRARVAQKTPSAWPGYLTAAAVAGAALALHALPIRILQLTSPAIMAILFGLAVRNLLHLPAPMVEAAKTMVRRLVPLTIVLTGAGLNLGALAAVGLPAVVVTVLSMAVAMAGAWYAGRVLGLWRRTSILIGAGTAICGNSAIVAVAPLIDAEDDDVMLSMTTINLLGLVLMFASPLLGRLLGFSDAGFGVWAGSTIHAVPQVVTAAFAYSEEAGALATLVKLVRVAFLAPLVFLLAGAYTRHHNTRMKVHYTRLIPPFIWGFLLMALLNTAGLLPSLEFRPLGNQEPLRIALAPALTQAGNWVLAVAMAAMGLEVNLRFLARVGRLALLVGLASCIAMCVASLMLIQVML
jgi:uncharacterized integral membrane protein (TIGR00698 family)